jgi:diadenosine tetraphosphate (Ap4A) HIT family hydrolase
MPGEAFENLKKFITEDMRMAHIYQPVMLRVLLDNGGRASRHAIASAFAAEDRAQIEYYEEIVRNMPGRVLANRGIVQRDGKDYRLIDELGDLSYDDRQALIKECNTRLADYLERRGIAPWQHRRKSSDAVSGSVRYTVIQRAKGRCEACGVSNEVRALEVDHIVPRNKGGTNDLWNLQALCYLCNAQKRDRDDTDFADVLASYQDREADCPFCQLEGHPVVAENELAAAFNDNYPVTEGHTLVIPKRHVSDYFELHQPERNAIETLLHESRSSLVSKDKSISGFNVGMNVGEAGGQTIFHAHVHLIPRRDGDTDKPRGGVRGVIPSMQSY